jgi:hypothetical protein
MGMVFFWNKVEWIIGYYTPVHQGMTCFRTENRLKVKGIGHRGTYRHRNGIVWSIGWTTYLSLGEIHVRGEDTERYMMGFIEFAKGERGGKTLDMETCIHETLETLSCIHPHMKKPARRRVGILDMGKIKTNREVIEFIQSKSYGETHGHQGTSRDTHPFFDSVKRDVFGEFLKSSHMGNTADAPTGQINASGEHFRQEAKGGGVRGR